MISRTSEQLFAKTETIDEKQTSETYIAEYRGVKQVTSSQVNFFVDQLNI